MRTALEQIPGPTLQNTQEAQATVAETRAHALVIKVQDGGCHGLENEVSLFGLQRFIFIALVKWYWPSDLQCLIKVSI